MGILPKKGALGHFVRVFVVFAGLFAPGTLAADPRSDLAPVRSLRRLTQTPVGYLQSTKLTADDGTGTDEFGKSVSIDGDTIVIGAWHDDDNGDNTGSVYVFTRDTAGDLASGWTQVAKLTVDDGASGDNFGAFSIDGGMILAGAPNNIDKGTETGAAYVLMSASLRPCTCCESKAASRGFN